MVNSFWFLSLVMSLSCALWATSLQQWARRYLGRAQPVRCNPERRARMRAFYADGVDKMHIPWAVEGLPTLLHLSLFLFFGGLAIFLFNVDREVFSYVVWWIGLFSLVYGMITLLPIVRHDSTYYSPLSTPAWILYTGIPFVTFKILAFITYGQEEKSDSTWKRYRDLANHYHRRMLGGVEKAAEEMVSERLPKIDRRIFEWTITTLGDDDSLKNFFEAIPGFFNSKLVEHLEWDSPEELFKKYSGVLGGFLGRTWSSNSVNNSEKVRRLDIAVNATSPIHSSDVWLILSENVFNHWKKTPQTPGMGQTLARLCTSENRSVAENARITTARVLVSLWERDDSWITLAAAQEFGPPERDLRDMIALGDDSVLLAFLINFTRLFLRYRVYMRYYDLKTLKALSKLDILNTLPRLQHDFCALWNEIVQEQRYTESYYDVLKEINNHYTALHPNTHPNTHPAPTDFSNPSSEDDTVFIIPFSPAKYHSYPSCNIASHRPDSTTHLSDPLSDALSPSPTDGDNAASQQADQLNNVIELPSSFNPTTASEIGATVVAAAPQDIASAATLFHPLEGSEQQDVVSPCAEPDISQILSTTSTPTPTPTLGPMSTSTPPVLDTLFESCDSGAPSASASSSFTATSVVVGFSNPVAPPPSHVLSSPNTEFVALLSSTTSSYPTSNTTLPHLRARGLVNSGNICFANAVLQILVRSPPFWNLFKELGSLKGQHGGRVPEIDGSVIPLVDATTRFIGEFLVHEKESPPIQPPPREVGGETRREDEENKEHNALDPFDPTYMYDAMKEKRQLKDFLVRFGVTQCTGILLLIYACPCV
jgi:hypothetical protein